MNTYPEKLRYFLQRKSVRYGIPFLMVVVGGSFGLKEFTHLRYQFSKNKTLTTEEAKKYGIEMKNPGEVTLETEFEKIKNLDIENWEQKRGPRPWENVISSSDEDDVTCSNKVIYQSPPKKKSNLKPKCSFSNTSKTILYTEETIGPHVKYLLRLVDSCKIKHNKNSLELNNLFNECHVYFRINEILCMDVGDMSHLKKVKVLGLYKNNGKYDILLDKTYSTKLYLNFTESIPISLSNVIVFGYLSLSKESKPILNVYSWEYINELLIKSYDNSMYSQRLHIQNIKKNLLSSKIDTECDIEMDSFDDNFMKQQDELLQQEFKQCLNISSDLF